MSRLDKGSRLSYKDMLWPEDTSCGFGWFMLTCTRSILLFARPLSKSRFSNEDFFEQAKSELTSHILLQVCTLAPPDGTSAQKVPRCPNCLWHHVITLRSSVRNHWKVASHRPPRYLTLVEVLRPSPTAGNGTKKMKHILKSFIWVCLKMGRHTPKLTVLLWKICLCVYIYIWYNDNQPW
jgi:hypothetical protein